jgi:mycofactocin precursor
LLRPALIRELRWRPTSRPFARFERRNGFVQEAIVETEPTTLAPADADEQPLDTDTELVEEELLVEEISIDGMCGVY